MATTDSSFDLLRAGQLVNKWDEVSPSPIGKTLVIGLGGTGKEVLLRFRRLIVEKYGALGSLPCVQFIQLDTDQTQNALEQYDFATKEDPLYKKIQFQPSERVNLTIEGGCSKYLNNMHAYPHIKEWFQTKGKIKDLADLGDGAGQVRMASRLGFFDNYQNIENAIRQAERRLNSERNRDIISAYGFEFEPSIMNIFVVASLAGGTGSGTFLDMGFLLKDIFPEGTATRISILFLPSFFGGYAGKTRMYANGYAALKELNHYSFGNSFPGNWSGGKTKPILPPPFDYTYLLDGKNDAGEMIGTGNEEYSMYQMVAEVLFQDFSIGDFAGTKRAVRINLKNFIDNAYVHNTWGEKEGIGIQGNQGIIRGDSFTTRFCSFGLSAIHYPTNRIHLACGCQLAQNILKRWQHSVVGDPRDTLIIKVLNDPEIQFVQAEYQRRDGAGVINAYHIEDNLLLYNPDSDSGQQFQNYIWNKASEIRRKVQLAPKGQKANVLEDELQRWDAMIARADSDDPDEWGPDIRVIQTNMEKYLKRLETGLRKKASELSDNPRFGVTFTLALFQELKRIIHHEHFRYLPYFENYINYWNDTAEYWLNRLEILKDEIRQHDNQFLFRKADINRDLRLLVPLNAKGEGILYNYYFARIMKQMSKRGKKICEYVDQKILGRDSASGTGLIGNFHRLAGGLSGLIERLEIKKEYFSKKQEFATIKNLYQKGDVDYWYREWMGDKSDEETQLKNLGDQLLGDIFQVKTVSEALDYIQKTPPETIEDKLIDKCAQVFRNKPLSQQPSALQMLFDDKRCSTAQRENLISGSYARAKVWLYKTHDVNQVDFKIFPEQKPYFIGIDESDAANLNSFRDLIQKKIKSGDNPPQYKNIGESNKGTIVFYNELAGATAFYPSSVAERGGLQQAYLEFCKNPNEVSPDNQEDIHIDKNRFKFMDIVPKTREESDRFQESVRAFILARILGVLKIDEVKEDDSTIVNHYSYEYEIDFDRYPVHLGDENTAVDILYQDERKYEFSHRKRLYDQAEEIVDELKNQRLLAVYLLLMEFYMYCVYPPKKDISAAGIQFERYSPFFAALDKERSRVRNTIVDNEAEYKKIERALNQMRQQPFGRDVPYEVYYEALKPYIRKAGKFKVEGEGTVEKNKRQFIDAFQLDRSKITPDNKAEQTREQEKPRSKLVTTPKIDEDVPKEPTRPCPKCKKPIPIQAIFCTHCQQTVASHIRCINCHEQTPDDLAECWNCGMHPKPREEKIKCLQCYVYEGPVSSFPCPECGWKPDAQAEQPENQQSLTTDENDTEDSQAPEDRGEHDGSRQDETNSEPIDNRADEAMTSEASAHEASPQVTCQVCGASVSYGKNNCPDCGEPLNTDGLENQ